MIRVGLVEDQQLVRQGIASLLALSPDIEIGWQAENGQEALSLLAKERVDLLLSDIRMPVMDGIALLKTIRAQADLLPVIMLTTFNEHTLFMASLQAGANGFLLKDVSLEKLILAITTVAEGGYLIEPDVLSRLNDPAEKSTQPSDTEPLTSREREILLFLAGGFSNKEVADTICLAEGTVKNHVSNILTKLGCRDRTQAVIKGLQLGLL